MYSGNYATWAEAASGTDGYDAPLIFEKNLDAARKVRDGKAVFERDSVCFYEEQFRWEPLACLLAEAGHLNGRLHVGDFGGSFGSFYMQHRKLLNRITDLSWSVIEQEHYVRAGRAELETPQLKYFFTLDEAAASKPIDITIFSGVLQCVADPYQYLKDAMQFCPAILLDRTPFIDGKDDLITRRTVNEAGYRATIASRFFSPSKLATFMNANGYQNEVGWPGFDGPEYQGQFYLKNPVRAAG